LVDNITNKVFDKAAGMIQSISIENMAKKIKIRDLKSDEYFYNK